MLSPLSARFRVYFNPLPSCEGRLYKVLTITASTYFNPLPSCEGRLGNLAKKETVQKFQCTPLMRGETLALQLSPLPTCNFNPLPSCEGRRRGASPFGTPIRFQSTPLMRGETRSRRIGHINLIISIHSPHARGDFAAVRLCGLRCDFNPLPSCEGRHARTRRQARARAFQSTPLMRGETRMSLSIYTLSSYFNPLPSCEGRHNT